MNYAWRGFTFEHEPRYFVTCNLHTRSSAGLQLNESGFDYSDRNFGGACCDIASEFFYSGGWVGDRRLMGIGDSLIFYYYAVDFY